MNTLLGYPEDGDWRRPQRPTPLRQLRSLQADWDALTAPFDGACELCVRPAGTRHALTCEYRTEEAFVVA